MIYLCPTDRIFLDVLILFILNSPSLTKDSFFCLFTLVNDSIILSIPSILNFDSVIFLFGIFLAALFGQ